MIFTILFFFKPGYRRDAGWVPPVRRKKKKLKVYKVDYEKKAPEAVPVDLTDFAVSLSKEKRMRDLKRRAKSNMNALLLMQFMMEDDELV